MMHPVGFPSTFARSHRNAQLMNGVEMAPITGVLDARSLAIEW